MVTPDENGWANPPDSSSQDDTEQPSHEPTPPGEHVAPWSSETQPSVTGEERERPAAEPTGPHPGGGGPSDTGGVGPEEPRPVTPSWERRAEIGFGVALVKTIGEVLFDPVTSFRHMPVTGGVGGPLVFVVLLGTVGSVFQAFYSIMGLGLDLILQMTDMEVPANVLITVTMMILSPALVAVGTFIGATILHLFLMLFGGANRGFEATFRVIAYVSGAAALLNIIPICGALILFVWSTVCEVIGLKQAHQAMTWQALLAVITPYLLLCCCCGGVTALVALLEAWGFGLAAQASP